jgi:hypothetical protein
LSEDGNNAISLHGKPLGLALQPESSTPNENPTEDGVEGRSCEADDDRKMSGETDG